MTLQLLQVQAQATPHLHQSFIEDKDHIRHPKRTTVPILRPLRELLDASPTGDLTYIVTDRGTPYKKESLGNLFNDDWCTKAGLEHCSAHGMRKAAAVILAERGTTAPQLCAIFGWTKLETAQIYIRKANKKTLAGGGLRLLEDDRQEAEIVPLAGGAKNGGTIGVEKRGKSRPS